MATGLFDLNGLSPNNIKENDKLRNERQENEATIADLNAEVSELNSEVFNLDLSLSKNYYFDKFHNVIPYMLF